MPSEPTDQAKIVAIAEMRSTRLSDMKEMLREKKAGTYARRTWLKRAGDRVDYAIGVLRSESGKEYNAVVRALALNKYLTGLEQTCDELIAVSG